MPYEVLIKGGTIYDGSGAPGARGDLAVSEGKVVAVGKMTDAATIKNAGGLNDENT